MNLLHDFQMPPGCKSHSRSFGPSRGLEISLYTTGVMVMAVVAVARDSIQAIEDAHHCVFQMAVFNRIIDRVCNDEIDSAR